MNSKKETRGQRIRRITLRNTMLSYLGYWLPIISSYIAIGFNLTSCTFRQMNYVLIYITISVWLFVLFVYLHKEVTYRMSNILGIMQLVNWLMVTAFWLLFLNEIRILALFSSMIPFVFFFAVGNIYSSLLIAMTFVTIYLAEAWYCIVMNGQGGSFWHELFFTFCFFYATLFLIGMTHAYKKQRKIIRTARADSEESKIKIEQTNVDLRLMYDTIKKTVADIYILSEQVAEDAAGITKSSKALSTGATGQVAAINEISKKMEQIDLKTSANAENSVQANELTLLAKESSRNGVLQMKEVNESIIDISNASSSISKIISTIDSIAFQTNLLALNAAVEAARAGKHGKGFSVVAQEVRNLALKSADAASNTTDLIEESLDKVETGTRTSDVAVKALDDINEKISAVTTLVEEITASSSDQTRSISEVNTAMSKISDITRETAGSAKDTNTAASRLATTAVKIHDILKQFDTQKDKTKPDKTSL